MNNRKLSAWIATSAGIAAAVVAGVANPAAAAAPMDASVKAGLVTLRPAAGGGYAGSMAIAIRYTGPNGASLALEVAAPEGLYQQTSPDGDLVGCGVNGPYTEICSVAGDFSNGETRVMRLEFTALAAPTASIRRTMAGSVTVTANVYEQDVVESTPRDNTARFGGMLIGTGSGIDPTPYRPATTYDLSVVAGSATVAPDSARGGYLTTIPLTVRAGTDAYQEGVLLSLLTRQNQQEWLDLVPESICVVNGDEGWICAVEFGQVPEDAERAVTAKIHTEVLPQAGKQFELRVDTSAWGETAADANPSDNIVIIVI